VLGPRPAPGDDAVPADEPKQIEGIRLKTPGQRRYVKAMRDHDLVFSVGPAGTGKTFLAVAMAVRALKAGEVQKIVLCRPAVEAGEKLGFLPGDASAKVNPYMRPLYDALNGILDFDTVKKYVEREVIEVAPLAYMRGRTLNNSFIILDEAQNTTKAQMKMFLTRMGEGSKIVVTGDVTQIDLPRGTTSGLQHAQSILNNVAGIGMITLGNADIVRHPLVWKIVERYEGQREKR
jgi:phosphate starvation-inducible protein PhoH and related proteins